MRSRFDPTRNTVGSIARDAILNADSYPLLVGDLTTPIMKDMVDDLNEALLKNPYNDEPFYVVIHESKDLMQPNMIKRKVITLSFRPYPEDDTIVFWKDPKTQDVRFCWCLPHWSEMDNILANSHLYDGSYVETIKAWKEENLVPFGFLDTKKVEFKMIEGIKVKHKVWGVNPKWQDQKMGSTR